MKRKLMYDDSLRYLYNPPKKVFWKVVAGPKPNPLQMYDLVFDKYDLKIRKLDDKIFSE